MSYKPSHPIIQFALEIAKIFSKYYLLEISDLGWLEHNCKFSNKKTKIEISFLYIINAKITGFSKNITVKIYLIKISVSLYILDF